VNLRQHVRFLTLISVISVVTIVGIMLLTQNINLAIFISLASDAIQIVLYGQWFFQKETDLSKLPEQVQEIRSIIVQEREDTRVSDAIVSRLIREGAVREEELRSLLRNKEIIIAFPYAEGLSKSISQMTQGQPLARLLGNIGFVRAARFQNLMVIMAEALPKQLRDVENLNRFIKQRLPKEWDAISEKVAEKYPEEKYKIRFRKWRSRAGFKASYILAKSMAQDFFIGYMNRFSFTSEFQKHIAGRINRNQLRRIIKIRRHKVKQVISKISAEFLLGDIPRNVRRQIINNEDEIKKALNVKVVTDYRLLETKNITDVLVKLLPSVDETLLQNCSTRIIEESQKCFDGLKSLGIEFE
jgi:hypothetical protein